MRISSVDPKMQWHSWFAWHPVLMGAEEVWLERVERRFMGGSLYEYRERTDR